MTAPSCAGHDPEAFFDPARVSEAQRVCAGCPLAATCLAGAEARGEEYGVWAGINRDPAAVVEAGFVQGFVQPAIFAPPAEQHGTVAAYPTCTAGDAGGRCAACRAANAARKAHYLEHGPVLPRRPGFVYAELIPLEAS